MKRNNSNVLWSPREVLLVKGVPGIRLYSQFLLRVDIMTALHVGLNEAIIQLTILYQ